jgi:hypothetical protein
MRTKCAARGDSHTTRLTTPGQFFPDLDALEKEEDERVAKVTLDIVRRNNHTKVVEAGLKRQAAAKRGKRKSDDGSDDGGDDGDGDDDDNNASTAAAAAVAPAKVKRQPKGAKKAAAAAAAAAAEAAAVARRTFFHHPANQKPQSVELLVRCADSVDKAIGAVFEGGRYVAAPAAMTVLSLRTYVAQRLQVSVDQVRLTIPSAAAIALDDRMPVSRIEDYWFERGPAVVEVALGQGQAQAVADNTVVVDD